MHYSIRFPPTSSDDQLEIFSGFLDQIPNNDVDKDSILDWVNSSYMVDNQFCGRQIRNILSAAMAIARANGRRLMLEDVRMLWRSTKVFQEFLQAQRFAAQDAAQMRRGQYETR